MRLQEIGESLLYLFELGIDNELAVSIFGMRREIIAMVVFGFKKFLKWFYLRNNGFAALVRIIQFFQEIFCFPLLRIICKENDRTILRADIISLPIHCCR